MSQKFEFFHRSISIRREPFLIFSLIFSRFLSNLKTLSNITPRYLYSTTIGYPLIYFYSAPISSLSLSFLLYFYMNMIPDFFLLIFISTLLVHYSTMSIASLSFFLPFCTITRSSAYAPMSNPLLLRSSNSSENAIMNKDAEITPP